MHQRTRSPIMWVLVAVVTTVVSIAAWAQKDPRELYERARMLDENNQDLAEAIKVYGQVAELAKDQPALAAKALLQMGQCHERLGQAEAVKAYQRVIDRYPQQLEEVKIARERLAALSSPLAQNSKLPKFIRLRIPTRFSGLAKLSADGKRIALVSENDLWVVSLDSRVAPDLAGEVVRLTRSGEVVQGRGLAWSKDGRWLAYSTVQEGLPLEIVSTNGGEPRRVPVDQQRQPLHGCWGCVVSLSVDGGLLSFVAPAPQHVRVMPVSGGASRQIGESGAWEPEFSPDGSRLAYVVSQSGVEFDGDLEKLSAATRSEVRIAPVAGGESVLVSRVPHPVTSPIWSPDGRWIAFLKNYISKELWIAPVPEKGGSIAEPVKIPLPYQTNQQIAGWTPDNRIGLVFQPTEGTGAVYTVPSSGGKATQVTPSGVIQICRWSPDGKRIYFRNLHEISYVPRDGGEVATVPFERSRQLFMAMPGGGNAVSPDGQRIVLSGGDTIPYLWLLPIAGGRASQLTKDSEMQDVFPTWSPDGKSIAFVRHRMQEGPRSSRDWGVYTVPADAGEPRRITTEADNVAFAKIAWSPDGKSIAFFSLDKSVKIVPADGGPSREVVRLDADPLSASELAWSPDSRRIAYTEHGRIWTVPVAGGAPSEIPTGVSAQVLHGLDWSPDGEKLAFVGFEGGGSEFWFMEDFLPLITKAR